MSPRLAWPLLVVLVSTTCVLSRHAGVLSAIRVSRKFPEGWAHAEHAAMLHRAKDSYLTGMRYSPECR